MPLLVYHLLFLLSHVLILVSSASNPTSFCKCTCGANSTIIPLDAPSTSLNTRSIPRLQADSASLSSSLHFLRPRDDAAADDDDAKEDDGKQDKGSNEGKEEKKGNRKKTCMDCNKQYCLSQKLHICEDVKLEDVFTTCFRMFLPLGPAIARSHFAMGLGQWIVGITG
ncbi:MAG: hypothetical protein LQ352_007990 [Teloschistes flavicans]|nr:MAG: hypothetical protein LQ352_007990 [Teloschistes flavicans]